ADDRQDRQALAVAARALYAALARDLAQAFLELADAVAHAAPVGLELALAGPATADSAGEPAHVLALADEQPHAGAQLGQLHLEPAFAAARVLGEDVEDQLRAVDDARLHQLGDVADLHGREVAVEDHQVDAALPRAQHQVLELAAADQVVRVGLGPAL